MLRLRGGGCGGSKPVGEDEDGKPSSSSQPAAPDPLKRRSSLSLIGADVRLTEKVVLDFDHVMADADGVDAMLEFAAAEFSDENMIFWVAVRDYKRFAGTDRPGTPREGDEAAPAPEVDAAALEEKASEIIEKYLAPGAQIQVTLSSAHQKLFKKKPKPGVYEYSGTMFDKVHKQVYKDLKNDTFSRFKLSDKAEELVRKKPMLAVADPSEAFGNEKVQAELQELMRAAVDLAKCDRMTAYFVDGRSLFSVCSSMLGNAIIKIPTGKGLAGKAAKNGSDVLVEDAWEDPDFNRAIDEQTGYKTKSVLCVVIRRNEQVIAVVQMLNKKGEAEDQVATFTEDDAINIRDKVGPPLLNAFEDVALNVIGDDPAEEAVAA